MHRPVQIESKHRAIHQTFRDHVIEHRGHSIHRDGGITHSKNAIKLCSNESDSRLFDGFTKCLIFNCNASDLIRKRREGGGGNSRIAQGAATHSDSILTQDSTDSSTSILDGKGCTIGFVCT